MKAEGHYRATKEDKEFEGTSKEIGRRINTSSKNVLNASSSKKKIKGYSVKRIGSVYEKYDLYKNDRLIDSNIYNKLIKAHYFNDSTVRVAMCKRQGKFYDEYQIRHSGKFKVVIND